MNKWMLAKSAGYEGPRSKYAPSVMNLNQAPDKKIHEAAEARLQTVT